MKTQKVRAYTRHRTIENTEPRIPGEAAIVAGGVIVIILAVFWKLTLLVALVGSLAYSVKYKIAAS